jgi:hypothetical protein
MELQKQLILPHLDFLTEDILIKIVQVVLIKVRVKIRARVKGDLDLDFKKLSVIINAFKIKCHPLKVAFYFIKSQD